MTKEGIKLLTMPGMSTKSRKSVLEKINAMRIHTKQWSLREMAAAINQKTIGWFNYYCSVNKRATNWLWVYLNRKLFKWIRWKRQWNFRRAVKWLKATYKQQPGLFKHWEIAHP